MRYDDPQLREALAGQYVLGALHGRARARFESLMRRDVDLRRLVTRWEAKLTPLAGEIPAVPPPPHVLDNIKRRLAPAHAPRPSLWERLGFWRGLSAGTTVAAVVFASVMTLKIIEPAPEVLVDVPITPKYAGFLTDGSGQPALIINGYAKVFRLDIFAAQTLYASPGQTLQLWLVERDSGDKHAVTPIHGDSEQITLSEDAWKLLKGAASLFVTAEPAGAVANAPQGHVLAQGVCINLKPDR